MKKHTTCLLLLLASSSAAQSARKFAGVGFLEDVSNCDVEGIEYANKHQLYGLLSELSNTSFFRFMSINMEGKCAYNNLLIEKKCNKTLPPLDGDSENVEGVKGKKKACDLDFGESKKPPLVNNPPEGMLSGYLPPPPPAAKTITWDEEVYTDATRADFWLDLCRKIPTNSTDEIDLTKNPGRSKEQY